MSSTQVALGCKQYRHEGMGAALNVFLGATNIGTLVPLIGSYQYPHIYITNSGIQQHAKRLHKA